MHDHSTPTSDIPVGFCQCGCGKRTRPSIHTNARLGLVRGVPVQFVKGHRKPRFQTLYTIDADSGCWNWTGTTGKFGYGKMNRTLNGERFISPHRYYYTLHKGPIPGNLPLDHLCRNRRCVNPDHLQPVTFTENIRRGKVTKLTADQVHQIKHLIATTTLSDKEIALRFGVIPATIWWIRTGRTWRET